MNIWARIKNGVVAELISLLADKDPAKIFAPGIVLVNVTSNTSAPSVGWDYKNGVFTPPSHAAAPTLKQMVRKAFNGGCQIVSASMPWLNGTYPIGNTALGSMAVNAHLIALNNGAFPANKAAIGVKDKAGALHSVTTPAAYLALYQALASYALELDQVLIAESGTLPSHLVMIP
jgi:hypothetical protein